MFSNAPTTRLDFADTRALVTQVAPGADGPRGGTSTRRPEIADAADLLARADEADLHLLRLVGCAALATLVLALATGLAL